MEILEYCEPSKVVLREEGGPCPPYLDLLNPEYNILKVAGSLLGFKHSPDTIVKMKNRIRTEDEKIKHLEQLKRLHASPEHKEHLKRLNLSPKRLKAISKSVEVFDTLNNETIIYSSTR